MSQNHAYHFQAFLEAWDTVQADVNDAAGSMPLPPISSPDGTTPIYPRSDPRFVRSIEPGISRLVLLLIKQLDCVTYSSCEGHPTSDHKVMVGQHVDIIARDADELHGLLATLSEIARTTPKMPTAILRTRRGTLDFENGSADSLSLEIVPLPDASWTAYKRDAEEIQRHIFQKIL